MAMTVGLKFPKGLAVIAIYFLSNPTSLSTSSGNNDDDNGGGKPDARCASNMARNSCHSTDRVGNIRTDNSRIPGSRFRLKSEHQNAAREPKPIRLPAMQSREAFSFSFSLL